MFDQTITVFNYTNKGSMDYSWKKTILTGVTWREKQTRTVNGAKTVVDTVVEITIPFRGGYIEPRKFNDDNTQWVGDNWTLNPYSGKDFVILGNYSGQLDYGADIQKLKTENVVGVISSVKDNTKFPQLKHWRIELSK